MSVRAFCREAPDIQLYWVYSEAGNSLPTVAGLRYPSNYHGIKATHRKGQHGSSVARLIYPLTDNNQLSVTIETGDTGAYLQVSPA